MAASFSPAISPGLQSRARFAQSSLSGPSKVRVGVRAQTPDFPGRASCNGNVEFHKGLTLSRNFKGKPTRRRVSMMCVATPQVLYRNPDEGTWQWVDLWNALYRDRIIFIGQEIDEEFSNQLLATMLYLESVDDSRKLYLYINGPGGDLTPCLAIYDTMQSIKNPVCTHCVGYAYHLSGFLLAAGEKGKRSSMPLSRIALSSPGGAARGQAADIRNEADELLRIRDYLFKELAEKTGHPVEKIYSDLSRVKRFGSQEALEYGLIDHIVRPSSLHDGKSSPLHSWS
ncbi:unnamed protein product [Cuscuta campestris]|uniref:ATP-dependent Clp protease proteolytic subunit n=1 Tax=Cuscuta campestris TaxID=132261 RepID=A0A484MHS2_9ASTE|nr:unnamed protein product [Cuscuta campestris]